MFVTLNMLVGEQNHNLRGELRLQCDFCVENNEEAQDEASVDVPPAVANSVLCFSHHVFSSVWSSMPGRTLNPRQDHLTWVHLRDIVSLTLNVLVISVKCITIAPVYCSWIEYSIQHYRLPNQVIYSIFLIKQQLFLKEIGALPLSLFLSLSLSLFIVCRQAFIK